MKTTNYQFTLMQQGQERKDFVYNETVLKLDSILNFAINDFVAKEPISLTPQKKYIISNGKYKNQICYFAHKSKGVQYNIPYENMIIYVINKNKFYIFLDNKWSAISFDKPIISKQNFVGIKDDFTLAENQNYQYLYLNGNANLNFGNINLPFFTLIIKQNYQNIFDLKWQDDILWPNKTKVKISNQINAIDLFCFYKLPESSHFLASVINQNYQY